MSTGINNDDYKETETEKEFKFCLCMDLRQGYHIIGVLEVLGTIW